VSPGNEERRPRQESGATTSNRPGQRSDLIVAERNDSFGYGGPRRDTTADLAIARVDRERAR